MGFRVLRNAPGLIRSFPTKSKNHPCSPGCANWRCVQFVQLEFRVYWKIILLGKMSVCRANSTKLFQILRCNAPKDQSRSQHSPHSGWLAASPALAEVPRKPPLGSRGYPKLINRMGWIDGMHKESLFCFSKLHSSHGYQMIQHLQHHICGLYI